MEAKRPSVAPSSGARDDSSIDVRSYDDAMRDEVVALFVAQYGLDREAQAGLFASFYDDPFQRADSIRIVALDRGRVCGFQSFFRWPYERDGRLLRTFQSGNSLVAPTHRGQGIFGRLLRFVDESAEAIVRDADFLMGFPVAESFGSFLRAGWQNPCDLAWMVRPIHPLSIWRGSPTAPVWEFAPDETRVASVVRPDQFRLAGDPAFLDWRRRVFGNTPHFAFEYAAGGDVVRLSLRPQPRGRATELIIGDIRCTAAPAAASTALVAEGLDAFLKVARRHRHLTFVSMALNPHSADDTVRRALRGHFFLPVRRRIHFIVRPIRRPDCADATQWTLYRSDVDTW